VAELIKRGKQPGK